jgi:hypothetical protein
MLSELELLFDVTRRLEEADLDYMLTGSMALNHYAQPRMTRDIDIVIALLLKDLEILPAVFISSSQSSIGRGIHKASGSSPMWKISSPPEPTSTTYRYDLKN